MKLISIPNQQQLASFIPSNDIVRMIYELFKTVLGLQKITNTSTQLVDNPISGSTVSIAPGDSNLWLNITSINPVPSLSIMFPLISSPSDGQVLIITATNDLLSIGLLPNGIDIIGQPTSLTPETPLLYRYSIDTNLWHLI